MRRVTEKIGRLRRQARALTLTDAVLLRNRSQAAVPAAVVSGREPGYYRVGRPDEWLTMQNLTGMAVFAAVVDSGSFSGAAVKLGLSKSAVSKQIARLEDRLGARLLNRSTRRVGLTDVGRTFYDHCVRILEEAEAAEQAVIRHSDEPRGRLRINAPMTFGTMHLAPAISTFLKDHPGVEIELELSDRIVDLIAEGFDMAVRITVLDDSSMIARRLGVSRQVVAASPDYLRRRGTPQHPQDLAGHDCLLYSYSVSDRGWRLKRDGDIHDVMPQGSLVTNNGEILRDAAADGLGVVALPSFIIGEELRSGRLRQILPDWQATERDICAVYPHKRHLSPNVRAFVDFLADHFGTPPYWDRAVSRTS